MTSSEYQCWRPPTRSEGDKVIFTLCEGSRSQGQAIHSIICMKTKTSVNWKLPKEVGLRKQVLIALESLENMTKKQTKKLGPSGQGHPPWASKPVIWQLQKPILVFACPLLNSSEKILCGKSNLAQQNTNFTYKDKIWQGFELDSRAPLLRIIKKIFIFIPNTNCI